MAPPEPTTTPALTRLLLDAGADPNDGESLYHSLENPACTRLLLERGARIAESNAIYRAIDLEDDTALKLLLAHGGDPNEPARNPPLTDWGSPLAWAIYRRRPLHAKALLDAGADPSRATRDGVSPYRLALQFGLSEVAALLQGANRCARYFRRRTLRRRLRTRRRSRGTSSGGATARSAGRAVSGAIATAAGHGGGRRDDVVKLMVRLGWPIAVRGGDWDASALNLAVFRGDAGLTRFLLEHGAKWTEQHGHGDNACGTLSWASLNEPVDGGDWVGCARALLDHGMPHATAIPDDPERVLIAGVRKRFSDEVTEELLG